MFNRRRSSTVAVSAVGVVLAFTAAACGSSSSGGSDGGTSPGANSLPAYCGGQSGSGKVLVGNAGFPENVTLANIYVDVLKACGYDASTKSFANREAYYELVKSGDIQVVPEYAATLTDFINAKDNGAKAPSKASGDIDTTIAHLRAELPSGLAVLDAATATDKNAFAVKKSFATANNITTLSELATYSKTHPISLAGPTECSDRPFCKPGLESTYGMKFSKFVSTGTDAGGPVTLKDLVRGKADLGLVFSSDPNVGNKDLLVLDDDKSLQASDNIVPLVASSLSTGVAASALNAVTAKLDQATLDALNKAVIIDHGTSEEVAQQFIAQNLS
ncbi:MAG TPA: ABC transporter substrate-binding protein [Mycobacteriales bacterium]|jgi:osmoprotectant transport system substrate-binding protein|nr:ABC transporter substrate-binding protein [Mycobacteriales bacterium]